MITSHYDLRVLYQQHCKCRTIDLLRHTPRADDAHGPDCHLVVLTDVCAALNGDYAATKRCDRYQRDAAMAAQDTRP